MTERRPGVWRLRVFVGNDPMTGRKRQASKTFHGGERAAETELARFVTSLADRVPGSPSMTFAALLDHFVGHCVSVGRSPTTIDSYRRHTNNVRKGIGRTPIAKLRPDQLDGLYSQLRSTGVPGGRGPLAPASVRRHHAFFSAALNQAVKWGWLTTNPAKRATVPSMSQRRLTAPSPAELRQLVEKATASRGPANGLLIALAAMTGARRGELAALRWSDVDIEAGLVHFRRAVKQVGRSITLGDTKTHSERSVTLPPAAVDALRAYTDEVANFAAEQQIPLAFDPFLFSPEPSHGRPCLPSSISQAFSRTAVACGLPYHLHQLRHFAATQAIAAGFDPVSVAARLGHADPSVTMRVYSHALDSVDKAIGEHLGELVEGPK